MNVSDDDWILRREQVLDAARAHFRPEFLNRLDEMIVFNRLGRDAMEGIVEIQLDRLQRILTDRKIVLEIDDRAKAWLAEAGYDPAYGARPLKRVIQRALQNPMASQILEGKVREGDTVAVSADDQGLVVGGQPVRAAAE